MNIKNIVNLTTTYLEIREDFNEHEDRPSYAVFFEEYDGDKIFDWSFIRRNDDIDWDTYNDGYGHIKEYPNRRIFDVIGYDDFMDGEPTSSYISKVAEALSRSEEFNK